MKKLTILIIFTLVVASCQSYPPEELPLPTPYTLLVDTGDTVTIENNLPLINAGIYEGSTTKKRLENTIQQVDVAQLNRIASQNVRRIFNNTPAYFSLEKEDALPQNFKTYLKERTDKKSPLPSEYLSQYKTDYIFIMLHKGWIFSAEAQEGLVTSTYSLYSIEKATGKIIWQKQFKSTKGVVDKTIENYTIIWDYYNGISAYEIETTLTKTINSVFTKFREDLK